ncbi:hypothetical protein [Streptomyces fructofermentans]|uniref:Uncharacterized protein n=1 Tax=Streptomyces fructofermentans TaxID=152141 RepID=A0A918N8Y1_9ACTN|nr:hypothetical protein [Streptomyces fructofermentans]GGX52252.1 hypothetical protein GCM10010515_19360 [Streptomyces fructofermentans]
MPRRRPASLRARERGWRSPWVRYRDVPGLSGAANAAVRVLERERLSPGVVSVALSVWSARVHGSGRRWRPWEDEFTCACCGEGWARDKLQEALLLLPPRAATELRVRVERLDVLLLRRTHHEPPADPDSPWWHGRR